jgi:hypothetical protein
VDAVTSGSSVKAAGHGAAQPSKRPSTSVHVQPKFRVRAADDAFEREADEVAAAVTRGETPRPTLMAPGGGSSSRSAGLVQRQADEDALEFGGGEEEEEEEDLLQPKAMDATGVEVSGEAADRISSLRGSGRGMTPSEREYFEPRFHYDFSRVRIHSGSNAAGVARSIGARAFATGNDVVFGAGQYDATSAAGRHLFAHELTHVVQQNSSLHPGAVQRDIIQRDPDDPVTITRVVIYLKTDVVIATLSDGSQIRLILRRKQTNLTAGEYQGRHTKGDWVDTVSGSGSEAIGGDKQWRFNHKEKKPRVLWTDIESGDYPLIVYGLRKEGTREEEIAARESKSAGDADKGKGAGDKGTGTSDKGSGAGAKSTKGTGGEKAEGTKGDQKPGAGGEGGEPQPETDAQKEARLKQFLDSLEKKGLPPGPPLDEETRKALLDMDAAQQEDLTEFLRDSEEMAEESIDTNAEIQKYLKLSASDRELLRVNLELKKGATAGPLPEKVRIGLEQSAEATAVGAKEASEKINEQLANLAAIHRKVTHDTLIDKEGASLEPIELEKLPVFREMMMLEGLLAGASTKSPEIEAAAKDLTKSIAGIRDYVLEEILWLAAEMTATAIFGALLGPIGTGAAIARGAMLLRRLNNLRKFLQKIEQVYSTYKEIDAIVKKVLAGYDQYKAVKPQLDAWVAELESVKEALDDPNLDEEASELAQEKLDALEERVIDEVHKQLESEKGLGALLEYFDIPADTDEEALKEILFNIPRGFEELKRLKTLYEASGKDLDATKRLAYRAVLVGVLLYPFVGFLAREIGTRLQNLMPEKDLGDRLLDVVGRATAGRKKYNKPGKKATQERLKKAKKPKDPKKDAEAREKKAAKKKKREEDKKKEEDEKKAEAEKDKKRTQKEKDEAKAANEWSKVVAKMARLATQHKEKGATKRTLNSQAKAIKKAHNKRGKVAGKVSVTAVTGRGEWKVAIERVPAGATAEAIVPMGYNERWERGREAVEEAVAAIPVDQRTDAPKILSHIDKLKEPYHFASLKVVNRREANRAGFTVMGAMGKMKDREITDIDDLTGLHTGEEKDPIPIYWYKDPSWYPGHTKPLPLTIDGAKVAFSMTSSPTDVTLKDGTKVPIGVDPANVVTPGKKLKRHSKHDRDYGQTDRLKEALKTAGHSEWVNIDIDHVTDLAFAGTNKFSNLWPLHKDKNRHAFSGQWYKHYGIEYLDKKDPKKSKVSTLYKLQHKWFVILDKYLTDPRKIGGRTPQGQ